MASIPRRRAVAALLVLIATLGSALAISLGLHLEPNVASLLPDRGEAAALRRYVRAFGGGDLAVVMVKGPDPDENACVARAVTEGLAARPSVKRAAEARGLDRVFRDAGFAWHASGCSLCAGVNRDVAQPGERYVSTSNRNFEGRQGAGVRTHLASPAMAAAAAVAGAIVDVRQLLAEN